MKLNDVLERGVAEVIPGKDGLVKLASKRKLKLYLGIDPTGTRLHLGHSIALRKLQQFADLGHEAILLFGTGTVLAGDPSQRSEARKKIAAEQIEHNISSWREQVKPIVDFNKVSVMYNAEWLLNLNLRDIIEIASNISAIQLIKRDMFQKRLKEGKTVWTHEILYPLLQGYDSVAMGVDVEIGGTDQTFNMLVGRELMSKMKNKEKYVLTVPMITGTDGKQMSKSSGNCIWLADTPNHMYGKLMSINDTQIIPYMELLTDIPRSEIEKSQDTPLESKKVLAHKIVTMYHGVKEATKAEGQFTKTFQKGEPDYSTNITLKGNIAKSIAPYTSSGSISEAKRLLEQGGVNVNGNKAGFDSILKVGDKVKIGTHNFGTIVKGEI